MGHCCHGNNLPNPVSETYLNGNLSALPPPSPAQIQIHFRHPRSPLLTPPSPMSWCVWPWLVALQRQHSPEVFKKIIEPAVKPEGAVGGEQKLINTKKKATKTFGEREYEWEEARRWFNSNCHVPAWNGDRLILALIWIYKMILSYLGRGLWMDASAGGKKRSQGAPRIWLRICDKT